MDGEEKNDAELKRRMAVNGPRLRNLFIAFGLDANVAIQSLIRSNGFIIGSAATYLLADKNIADQLQPKIIELVFSSYANREPIVALVENLFRSGYRVIEPLFNSLVSTCDLSRYLLFKSKHLLVKIILEQPIDEVSKCYLSIERFKIGVERVRRYGYRLYMQSYGMFDLDDLLTHRMNFTYEGLRDFDLRYWILAAMKLRRYMKIGFTFVKTPTIENYFKSALRNAQNARDVLNLRRAGDIKRLMSIVMQDDNEYSSFYDQLVVYN